MHLAEALRWLDSHQNLEGFRATRHLGGPPLPVAGASDGLSLDSMTELMESLGDPHRAFRSIHVTGTNGKGSVVRFVDAILRQLGLSVARYTSPHLERINERLVWDGRPITDSELAAVITLLADIEPQLSAPASYFELLTAAAYAWFAEVGAEVAAVEVGLLGQFDATNVIDGDVAVVTNIGKDHTDGVGEWRRRVLEEKAGIIGAESHVVVGAQLEADLLDIVTARPHREMWVAGFDFGVEDDRLAVGGHVVSIRTPYGLTDPLFVPLHGAYQPFNVATAVASVEAFLGRSVDDDLVNEALAGVEVPGRFEVVRRTPTLILEGAHNPDGARAAKYTLDTEFARLGSWILVVGFLNGKDPGEMLDALGAADFDAVIVCEPSWSRAIPAEVVGETARARRLPVEVVADPNAALGRALAVAGEEDLVMVSGSLYLVGEVRRQARSVIED